MELSEMIRAIQGALHIQVDGRAGAETWGAIYAALVKPTVDGVAPAAAISSVDPRSETNIATLQPQVQGLARALVQKAADNGIGIKVLSGTRS